MGEASEFPLGRERQHWETEEGQVENLEYRGEGVEGFEEEPLEEEEEEDEDEGELVLTDEWMEFFARSDAKRQERKKQQRREEKMARREARQDTTLPK